ncbi:hypothetical protein G9A89_013407 [Geosiphon pyriformis]|nr:hypothetical protein G9A89_013407 [Geosiphon pyriformis]
MKMLGKPLGKIDFSAGGDNDNILSNVSLDLSLSLKNVVNVSVCKSFALDIGLDEISGKSSQEKLMIIRATFTSESSLMKATKLATNAKILVNTNLKKSTGYLDQAVVLKKIFVDQDAVGGTVAEDYIGSVGGKTCMIDCYPVTYARARCTIVCFESAESLDTIIGTTPVLKDVHLCWSYLGSAVYAKCGKLGHSSLGCVSGGKSSSGGLPYHVLSDADKSRLAAIYAKCLAPIAHPVSFGDVLWTEIIGGSSFSSPFVQNVLLNDGFFSEMKPTLQVSLVLNDRFATLEHSLTSLVEHVDKLTKKLDAPGPMNQGADTVISKSLGVDTNGGTVAEMTVFDSLVVLKIKETLKNFSITVMSLLAKMDNAIWKIVMCNVQSINVSAKQEDIFEDVWVFTSGLDKGFLGAGVAIIMNICLVYYVSKIEEVLSWMVLVYLLFKSKLLVTFLGLYASASADARFGQTLEVNLLIAKTVNFSTFVVLGGDFNENGSEKSVSFKFCLDLGLVNSFAGHHLVKTPTWSNSKRVEKTIDYIFFSESLSSTVASHGIGSVSGFFDTDHKAVTVSIGLGGFLDICLNSLHKQTNKNCWKFRIKDANSAKWSCFKEHSSTKLLGIGEKLQNAGALLDLDLMHWFSEFQCSRNKQFSRFFGLEMLVAKIVRVLGSVLDASKASIVLALIQDSEKLSVILKHLSLIRKEYWKSKMYESWLAEEASIREAIVKQIDKFCLDKGGMIRSVLHCSFHKVVLNHLIVDDGLVLEPEKVKVSVDNIMESWTRK